MCDVILIPPPCPLLQVFFLVMTILLTFPFLLTQLLVVEHVFEAVTDEDVSDVEDYSTVMLRMLPASMCPEYFRN